MMDINEAKKIFADIKSLVYVFGGDIRQKAIERGIPEGMVDELIKNDSKLSKFISAHDMSGEYIGDE